MVKHLWVTWRGFLLILAVIACFSVAMVNHSFFAAMLGWLGGAYLCTSLLMSLFSLHGYSIKRSYTPNGTVGQLAKLPLKIECSFKKWRQPILVVEELPFAEGRSHVSIFEPEKQSSLFERGIMAIHRGEYKLDKILLRGGDPAGLFVRERCFSLPATMLVYPKAEKMAQQNLFKYEAVSDAGECMSAIASGNQEFRSLRKYVPTDPMKQINWKSSARQRKLMVREDERNTIVSIALFVDGQRDFVENDGANLEAIISKAAGIFQMCSDIYCTFTFISGGFIPASIVTRPVAECFAQVMYELAVMRPGYARLATLIDDVSPRLPSGTLVFCLSLKENNPILQESIEKLKNNGMMIM